VLKNAMDREKIAIEIIKKKYPLAKLRNKALRKLELNPIEKSIILQISLSDRANIHEIVAGGVDLADKSLAVGFRLMNHHINQTNIDTLELLDIIELFLINPDAKKILASRVIDRCSKQRHFDLLLEYGIFYNQRLLFHGMKKALELGFFEFYLNNSIKINSVEASKKLELLYQHYLPHKDYSLKTIFKYMRLLDEPYTRAVSDIIEKFEKLMPPEKSMFNLRSSSSQKSILINRILSSLYEKKGFSLMRISDGEAYGFSNDKIFSKRQEIHWWGAELPRSLRAQIKAEFMDSLSSEPDILGFPSPYMFVHYLSYSKRLAPSTKNLDTDVINRLYLVVLEILKKIERGKFSKTQFCENRANIFMFNHERLRQITALANRVIVISGFKKNEVEQRLNFDHSNKVVGIEIPTHHLLKTHPLTKRSSESLPYVYNDITSWISTNAKPGDLFLISAGFIGKTFVTQAANRGAVALDIGQKLISILQDELKLPY
jgi:hypothetical protein